ncbi:ADP-ribosylglycohydrolase family protein [Nitrosophilus alvini]|uniref:ADP-ribosylglycohydrolase family protein n=1 Tax=Nitrosophilus alvini TaxID=2714855 RepID=UPI00190AE443|nr:ADP-ribosylglycohydrolase family protein [Nitrosophilus alvini]
MDIQSRALGMMLGIGIGDALGAPVEFLESGAFSPVDDYRAGGKFNLPAGYYTDDTAMTLCLADSLIKKRGCDLKHQLENYIKWLNEGFMSSSGQAVGCGKNTYSALLKYMKTKQPVYRNKNRKNAGNGSLMRIAPVAIFYRDNLKKAMQIAGKTSYTTHALKICADACMVYSGILVGILSGMSKKDVLSEEFGEFLVEKVLNSYKFDEKIVDVIKGSYKSKDREEIESSGYVVHSLEASLWAFYHTESFKEAVLCAVNLGKDSDTIGAICAMAAGGYYGVESIDEKYKEKLKNYELICNITQKLLERRGNE